MIKRVNNEYVRRYFLGVWDNCQQLKALDQKMLFISSLKLFSFLRHLHFRLDFLFRQENRLISNLKLISEFTTSQIGQQINIIYISPDISICKGNQAMEFSKLIKYNLWNIFLSKIMLITKQGDQFQTFFGFSIKFYIRQKQVVSTLDYMKQYGTRFSNKFCALFFK